MSGIFFDHADLVTTNSVYVSHFHSHSSGIKVSPILFSDAIPEHTLSLGIVTPSFPHPPTKHLAESEGP